MLYKNLGRIAKTYYGITWQPDEQHESPGYINDSSFLQLSEQYQQSYTVKFKNHDGKLISSQICMYGELPQIPENPIRKASSSYSYTFTGWKPDVSRVIDNAEYIASYLKVDMRLTKHNEIN